MKYTGFQKWFGDTKYSLCFPALNWNFLNAWMNVIVHDILGFLPKLSEIWDGNLFSKKNNVFDVSLLKKRVAVLLFGLMVSVPVLWTL